MENLTEQAIQHIPQWVSEATVAWLGLVGAFLWLAGGQVVRPAFGLAGLIIGAGAALALGSAVMGTQWTIVWLIAGAVVGAVIGFLLYRMMMAAILALILALIAPWAAVIFSDAEMPQTRKAVSSAVTEVTEEAAQAAASVAKEHALKKITTQQREHETRRKDATSAHAQSPLPPVREWLEPVIAVVKPMLDAVGQWWRQIPDSARATAIVAALIGGALGLVIGLILPGATAALVSAVLGALMMTPAALRLAHLAGDPITNHLPTTPRAATLTILLTAILGAALQWAAWGKPSAAKKKK